MTPYDSIRHGTTPRIVGIIAEYRSNGPVGSEWMHINAEFLDIVLFIVFGGGFTWGSVLMRL